MTWPKNKIKRTSALVFAVPMQEAGQSINEVQTKSWRYLSTSIYRLYRRNSTALREILLVRISRCMKFSFRIHGGKTLNEEN